MKTPWATAGLFQKRPFYRLDEIEIICADALRAVGLYPSKPEPIRIERFIEKHFHVHPRYDDLPDAALGFTRFGTNGVEEIVIARALVESNSKSAQRRVNTTLAHEAGHGLLHAHLFALVTPAKPLFDQSGEQATPHVLCRDESLPVQKDPGLTAYDGRWWEFQANRAIGALLLPKSLVELSLRNLLVPQGLLRTKVLQEKKRHDAECLLSEIFDVNPIVVRIRILEIYAAVDGPQMLL